MQVTEAVTPTLHHPLLAPNRDKRSKGTLYNIKAKQRQKKHITRLIHITCITIMRDYPRKESFTHKVHNRDKFGSLYESQVSIDEEKVLLATLQRHHDLAPKRTFSFQKRKNSS